LWNIDIRAKRVISKFNIMLIDKEKIGISFLKIFVIEIIVLIIIFILLKYL